MSASAAAVPSDLTANHREFYGDAFAQWFALGAPEAAALLLERWDLVPDGPTTAGAVAWIIPVVRSDGSLAVLKLQPDDDETRGEPYALRLWDGDAAVRLLAVEPELGWTLGHAMLLDRLDNSRDLFELPVSAALDVIGALLRKLQQTPPRPSDTIEMGLAQPSGTPPRPSDTIELGLAQPSGIPPLRRIREVAARLVAAPQVWAESPDRELLDRCAAVVAAWVVDSTSPSLSTGDRLNPRSPLETPQRSATSDDRLLHGDAHYANVLAARDPAPDGSTRWLAIDPKPAIGPRGYDLLPAIHNRWDEAVATGDATREALRRFDQLRDLLELDRDEAAAWTVMRCLELLAWVAAGHEHWAIEPDRIIAVALLARLRG